MMMAAGTYAMFGGCLNTGGGPRATDDRRTRFSLMMMLVVTGDSRRSILSPFFSRLIP